MRNFQRLLSDKQRRWIDEYLIDFNGAAAALRAGYSPKSARSIAHENLTKPDIQAVLQARQAVTAKELQITRQGVIRGLLDAVEMGRELNNPASMISGLSTIAKILNFYAPEVKRVEFSSDHYITHSHMATMTDAELLALIPGQSALA